MTKLKTAIAIAVGTLFAGAAFAQSNYSIEQRDRMEQERIERGIESGRLTQREADRLLSERAQIERMERRARADGVLTQRERARIVHAQDRLARDIYRESHDRQVAGSHWRTSDRPYGWDRRDAYRQRDFNRGVRSDHFNRRDAYRVERYDSHLNGAAMRHGSESRFGRSDLAPGRQPHLQQTDAQRTHVQQAQSRRSWTRPADTSTASAPATGTATTAIPAVQTQRSWARTARTTTTATAGSSATQPQTQRSWTRTARTSTTATAATPVNMTRQGGYSGRRYR